jgi:GT2 family glycosyltransferase
MSIDAVVAAPALQRRAAVKDAVLERAHLAQATPVAPTIASAAGAPEDALEMYPTNRLLRTGGNLGYATAANRAVADIGASVGVFPRREPRCAMGTPPAASRNTSMLRRWPTAASVGPLIRDLDGSVYPSARHLPSLIRVGMHAVIGPVWRTNPWTTTYRQERLNPSERPVGWLSGSPPDETQRPWTPKRWPPAPEVQLPQRDPNATIDMRLAGPVNGYKRDNHRQALQPAE